MAYTPTEWASGDVVTSQKLNKLEQGVADAGGSFAPDITDPQDGNTLVYNATQQKWVNGAGGGGVMIYEIYDEETHISALNKTWQEIYDGVNAGNMLIWFRTNDWICYLSKLSSADGIYEAEFYVPTDASTFTYYATAADGQLTNQYPE